VKRVTCRKKRKCDYCSTEINPGDVMLQDMASKGFMFYHEDCAKEAYDC
jgi:ribosomal protein L24E